MQAGGLPRRTLEGHKLKRCPPATTLKLPASLHYDHADLVIEDSSARAAGQEHNAQLAASEAAVISL